MWLSSMRTGGSDMALTWKKLVSALDKRPMSSATVISSLLGPVPALSQAGAEQGQELTVDMGCPWGTPGRAGTQSFQAGICILVLVPAPCDVPWSIASLP